MLKKTTPAERLNSEPNQEEEQIFVKETSNELATVRNYFEVLDKQGLINPDSHWTFLLKRCLYVHKSEDNEFLQRAQAVLKILEDLNKIEKPLSEKESNIEQLFDNLIEKNSFGRLFQAVSMYKGRAGEELRQYYNRKRAESKKPSSTIIITTPEQEKDSQQIKFEKAREIMKDNMILPSEINKFLKDLNIGFNKEQQGFLENKIPFNREILEARAEHYALFPGYPLNIVEMKNGWEKCFNLYAWSLIKSKAYAILERVEPRWYLMQKNIIPVIEKEYKELEKILPSGEELPRACEIIFQILSFYFAKGQKLFFDYYKNFKGATILCSDDAGMLPAGQTRASVDVTSNNERFIYNGGYWEKEKNYAPSSIVPSVILTEKALSTPLSSFVLPKIADEELNYKGSIKQAKLLFPKK